MLNLSTLNSKHIFIIQDNKLFNQCTPSRSLDIQTGSDVLPRRDEGSDKPSATIEPHRIMDLNPGNQIESPMSYLAIILPRHYSLIQSFERGSDQA